MRETKRIIIRLRARAHGEEPPVIIFSNGVGGSGGHFTGSLNMDYNVASPADPIMAMVKSKKKKTRPSRALDPPPERSTRLPYPSPPPPQDELDATR